MLQKIINENLYNKKANISIVNEEMDKINSLASKYNFKLSNKQPIITPNRITLSFNTKSSIMTIFEVVQMKNTKETFVSFIYMYGNSGGVGLYRPEIMELEELLDDMKKFTKELGKYNLSEMIA